ncbi:MAG: hypothetical protein GX202_01780 [Firmicutes bacterium]|nr:hypothetical protein [Bacillota bacterium]
MVVNVNPATIQILEDTKLEVVFINIADCYSLSVDISGEGSVTKNPDKDYYVKGEAVTIFAVPKPGWYFDHWEGDAAGSSTSKTFTMDSDKYVKAVFKTPLYYYVLTRFTEGRGHITKEPSKPYYTSEETVTIRAIPEPGWYFDHWEGDISGTEATVSLRLQKDTTVIAVFKECTYTINVNIIGGGTVTLAPEKDYYRYGDVVAVSANPAPGWLFDSWSGSLSGSNLSHLITVNQDMNITAKFKDKVQISFNKSATDHHVWADYLTSINVGSDLVINLGWYYIQNGQTYYLKVDNVSISPYNGYSSYSLSPVSLDNGYATQTITIENVQTELNINVVIGEYVKVNTIAYRADGTVFPSSFLKITQSPAPSYTVYETSGLYKKGERVTFSAPPYTQAHVFHYWRWEGDSIWTSNNPVTYTINKSGTLGAYYDEL